MGAKGPSQSGTITQTTTNPVSTSQLPYLESGWETAQGLASSNPYQYYPGATMAPYNPAISEGYNDIISTGQSIDDLLLPLANSIFGSAASGGSSIYASPSYEGLLALADGTALSTSELNKTASGEYLNSNPYLDEMFGSAADAVTQAYQTATAPNTAANFAGAGRYGSGAMANAVSQNESDLARQLGDMSAQIYGTNYQAERARQDAAAQALAMIQGGALGQLQSGFQAGNTNALQALQLYPQLLNSQFAGAEALLRGGMGLTGMDQAQIQDEINRFYGTIAAPWQTNQQYLSQIGQPVGGSSTVTSPLLGPNPMSSALSTATGLSSLFGKGSAGKGAAGGAAAPLLAY